jgi:hypothetical protein
MSEGQGNASRRLGGDPLFERQPRRSPMMFLSVVAFSALVLLGVFAALLQMALPK